jgi:hypothetical protein
VIERRRALFHPTPSEEVGAAQAALDRAASDYPVTLEALIKVKACVCSGVLPGPGGLDDQDCGYADLVLWLAARGILEGVVRGGK